MKLWKIIGLNMFFFLFDAIILLNLLFNFQYRISHYGGFILGDISLLKQKSTIIIGHRNRKQYRINWVQIYETTGEAEEEDLRWLLDQINDHIFRNKIKPGSARKFLDGKLLYEEVVDKNNPDKSIIYCIFTEYLNIRKNIKSAFRAVITRGGIYSAKRLFAEMIDLLSNEDKLKYYDTISVEDALKKIENYELESMSLNELGYLISLINHRSQFTQKFLEKIYLIIYQSMEELEQNSSLDTDEFLDATFIVAQRYETTGNFHLALELYKKIIPLAEKNNRFTLSGTCQIHQAILYDKYFENIDDIILESLKRIEKETIDKLTQNYKEKYHYLLAKVYCRLNDEVNCEKQFRLAIQVSKSSMGNIYNPIYISEAYEYIGDKLEKDYLLTEAIRYYLTAATISFSSGNIDLADKYRKKAANCQFALSYSLIHHASILRMKNEIQVAEFQAWDALRILISSYTNSHYENLSYRTEPLEEIMLLAEKVLVTPGKIRRHKKTVNMTRKVLEKLHNNEIEPGMEDNELEYVSKFIERFIPIPDPIFLLLTADGRLILMGQIGDDKWRRPKIKGVLLSGILSAIIMLISEVRDSKSTLKTVDTGSFKIIVEQQSDVVTALLVDRDIQVFRNKLREILQFTNDNYYDILHPWDGHTEGFDDLVNYVASLLSPKRISNELKHY